MEICCLRDLSCCYTHTEGNMVGGTIIAALATIALIGAIAGSSGSFIIGLCATVLVVDVTWMLFLVNCGKRAADSDERTPITVSIETHEDSPCFVLNIENAEMAARLEGNTYFTLEQIDGTNRYRIKPHAEQGYFQAYSEVLRLTQSEYSLRFASGALELLGSSRGLNGVTDLLSVFSRRNSD